jgi:hypothetical protein
MWMTLMAAAFGYTAQTIRLRASTRAAKRACVSNVSKTQGLPSLPL